MSLIRTDNKLRVGGQCFATDRSPEGLVAYHLRHGFSAAYDPGVEDPVLLEEIKAAYREAGIVIAETGAYALNVLDTNPVLREQNIDKTCRRLERAERVGSLCCVGHGGTVSTGGWFAHNPENFSQASFDATVVAVRRILDTVKPEHTTYVLETESRLLPDSPEIYLELIKAVDRPRFGVHLDPFNIISSPRRFYFSDEFIRTCFRLLGPYVVSCHSKDIKMVKDSQTHFHETFTGDGEIDYRAYIAEVVKLEQDVPMMIEHFPERQQDWGYGYIVEQAAAVGVTVRNAELRTQ
jgi:sugar phosphate isomerase/epimerase